MPHVNTRFSTFQQYIISGGKYFAQTASQTSDDFWSSYKVSLVDIANVTGWKAINTFAMLNYSLKTMPVGIQV